MGGGVFLFVVLGEETEYLNDLVEAQNFKAVELEVQRLDPRNKVDEEEEIIKGLNGKID